MRQARSVAAIGSRSRGGGRTGSLSRLPFVPKNTFGIIPTLAPINLKDQKQEYLNKLKHMRTKDDDADRFLGR